MTKSLTEKWENGELYSGVYYCKTKSLGIKKLYLHHKAYGGMYADTYSQEEHYPDEDIEEILAPVPSYDEYCNLVFQANKPRNPLSDVMMCYDTEREKKVVEPLQKKLEIATKALNGIRDVWANNPSQFSYIARIANRKAKTALEEMEGVK